MTTTFTNNAEGGTNAVTVSTANSGGFSGDAFTQTANGSGGAITFSSVGPYRNGMCFLFTQTSALTQYLAWDQASATAGFRDRFYFYTGTTAPDVNHVLYEVRSLSGSLGNVALSPTWQLRVAAGTTTGSFSVATLSPSTWYRIDIQGDNWGTSSTTFAVQAAINDNLTNVISQSISGATTTAAAQRFRYGKPATSGISNYSGYRMDDLAHIDGPGAAIGPSSPDLDAFPTVAAATGSTFDVVPTFGLSSISATVDAQTAQATVSAPFVTGSSISVDELVSAIVAIGEAYDAVPKVGPGSDFAAATGAAFDATIAGTSIVSVSANLGAATGTAFDALVLINGTSPPLVASATGSANDATVQVVVATSNASAEFAEALGQAFDATVIADSGVIYFFTTPTVKERWAGRHGLWSRLYLDRGVSILRFGEAYLQVDEPSAEQVTAADAAYIGGRTYRVSKVEAGRLRAAGYGQWVVEAPDPEEHVEE